MDKDKVRTIAALGGKTSHAKGTAHEWTAEEAAAAGRKGGLASAARRLAKRKAAEAAVDDGA